jgi:hypothetical protein
VLVDTLKKGKNSSHDNNYRPAHRIVPDEYRSEMTLSEAMEDMVRPVSRLSTDRQAALHFYTSENRTVVELA